MIGYARYESEEAWEVLCNLYAVLRLYLNFFQPTLKLLTKIRKGSKIIKKYDRAKTPYQRVLASGHIDQKIKDDLKYQYNNLDPIALQKQIKRFQEELCKLASTGPIVPVAKVENEENKQGLYLSNRISYRKKKSTCKHNYRTRKDPFENVKDFINLELQLNPCVGAKEILEKLITKYPGDFYKGHLRTLQRRVKEIRNEQDKREKKYQELMISKRSMTTQLLNNTMI